MKQLHLKTLFFLTILLLPLSLSCAQEQYVFHRMNTNDGLSSNTINCLFADSRGYLWIGTESGLNRYDGYGMLAYYSFDKEGKTQANNIQSIQEDAEGKVWIEANQTYVLYKGGTVGFERNNEEYLKKLGITVKAPYRVSTDSEGNLYVATSGRMYYFDFKTKNVLNWNLAINMKPGEDWFLTPWEGGLFLACNDNIFQFNSRNGQLTRIALPESMSSAGDRLRCYVDNEGVVWIFSTMSEQLFRYRTDKQSGTMVHLESGSSQSNSIRSVLDDGIGHIWITTDHAGVFVYTKRNYSIQHLTHNVGDQNSLASDNITCSFKDKMGTIWLGHMKKGISYTNDRYLLFQNRGHQCGDISTVFCDSKGNLWLGTDGNGLYKEIVGHESVSDNDNIVKTALPNITISSVIERKNGEIWVGTYNEGIYIISPDQNITRLNVENGKLPSNAAWRLVEDNNGNVWMCSAFYTITRINASEGTYETFKKNTGEIVNGMSLYYDKMNTLYVGTFYGIWACNINTGKGVLLLGNKAGTQKFLSSTITSLHMDNANNTMWIGHSAGITIWNMKSDSLFYIDRSSGLADNAIRNILQDANENIWVSTGAGISCIKVRNEDGFQTVIRNYTTNDGIVDNYFNTYSATKTQDGSLIMGNPEGYTKIDPSQLIGSAVDIKAPRITQVMIGDSVLIQDPSFLEESTNRLSLDLQYDDSKIAISFFTGNLLSSNNFRYAYRIAGIADDWVYTDEPRIVFVSFPSGHYELEIKACGEAGEWSEVTVVELNVAPPFYRSVWMILLYIVVVAIAVFLTVKYIRNRQIKRLHDQKIRLEHDQFVRISDMKLRFFTNVSHDLRTPLTLIISPLQALIKEPLSEDVKKRLEVVLKNAEILLQQVNNLLDFRRLDVGAEFLKLRTDNFVPYLRSLCNSFADYARDRSITFSFDTESEEIVMGYDAEKMNKIMYNLLSNAFKFTQDGGRIRVFAKEKDTMVVIRVEDTGIGITDADKARIFNRFFQGDTHKSKAGSGIGLHIVNEYVKLHGGTIEVLDNHPTGAVFQFTLPRNLQNVENAPEEGSASTQNSEDANTSEISELADKKDRFVVLVVDDNTDMCHFVADSLRGTYDVMTAYNGRQALDIILKEDIDLVVSDVMMPEIDGLELCKLIKTDLRFSHIPVLLLTAKIAQESILEGLQMGADDYITKPFNVDMLRLRVEKFIEKRADRYKQFKQKMEINPSEITITSVDEELIKKAIEIVEKHIDDQTFSVEVLGQELGLSRTYLYKKLMNITGHGPQDFIRTLKLKRGKQLLEQSQLQISEIAYRIGYNTPKRFTENFKAEFGISPKDYRKRFLEE